MGPRAIDGSAGTQQYVAFWLPKPRQLQRQRTLLWGVRRFVPHTDLFLLLSHHLSPH